MFERILIANRGEIACRIMRACHALNIKAVAVYSVADAGAKHVREADAAVHIGSAPARDSYLNMQRVIDAAMQQGCQAIHPGYGFLSENADFVDAVTAAGLVFIGPSAGAMRAMGSKLAGRASALAAGVPVAAGLACESGLTADDIAQRIAKAGIAYPVLIKAVAGGGGRGMRRVDAPAGLADALAAAQREAAAAFGDGRVFVEQCIERPRHVEIQILADLHGECISLFERECSIQRRHQKIIEESPSPALDAPLRQRMMEAAVRLAQRVGYANAGTMEFLLDAGRAFYFLEMNTRLQVEHPVTEMVTGLDLVQAQIRIAAGGRLTPVLAASRAIGRAAEGAVISARGHAIECRICAEDPANQFLPSTGTLAKFVPPGQARVEAGFTAGDVISVHYDSLVAKFITHADTRALAIAQMQHALRESVIEGITTNIAFLRDLLAHPVFLAGNLSTAFVDEYFADWSPRDPAALDEQLVQSNPWYGLRGFRMGVARTGAMRSMARRDVSSLSRVRVTTKPVSGTIASPMSGLVLHVLVKPGETIARGTTLLVVEAMKMEMRITAPRDGVVDSVNCAEGDAVEKGRVLLTLASA